MLLYLVTTLFLAFFLDYVHSERDIGFRIVCVLDFHPSKKRNSIGFTMMFLYFFVNTFLYRKSAQKVSSSTFKD